MIDDIPIRPTKEELAVGIAELCWLCPPLSHIARHIRMAPPISMTTSNESHCFLIIETHAAKNCSDVSHICNFLLFKICGKISAKQILLGIWKPTILYRTPA